MLSMYLKLRNNVRMTQRTLNDRYILDGPVGEGGMGVTYKAHDNLIDRVVAVKMMREQFASDPAFIERFLREVRSSAKVSHENIRLIYDTGQADGNYYIVMEYVEGEDMKQRLRREGPLPLATAVEFGRQIAAAIAAAHKGGLVHRDIKPHNILITTDGKIKVTDFGIAKQVSEGDDTGVIVGSVHYLSPEQARGENTTPLSDIYSLGAVLFEMFTGRTMFEGEGGIAVAHKQIYEKAIPPRQIRPKIPAAIEHIIMRCLEKEPRNRYQSAADVAAALERVKKELHQDETVVIQRTAMTPPDATMIYRKPAAAAAPAPEPVSAPRRAPAPPYQEPPSNNGWLIVSLFVMLGLFVIGATYILMRPPGGNNRPALAQNVPNLCVDNLTKDRAISLLKLNQLNGEAEEEYSETTPKGIVFRQSPNSGTDIDAGSTVRFTVSKGPAPTESLIIPDFTGKGEEEARKVLTDMKYTGTIEVKKEISTLPKDTITRTEPPVKTPLGFKDKLTIVIAMEDPVIAPPPPPEDKPYEITDTFKYRVKDEGQGPAAQVFVRVTLEKAGEDETEIFPTSPFMPESNIPTVTFKRMSDKKAVIRLYTGPYDKNVNKLTATQNYLPVANKPVTP